MFLYYQCKVLKKLLILCVTVCYTSYGIVAQSDFLYIDSINIAGNTITEDQIILREMDIRVGDTMHIDNLAARLNINEKRLLSIGLFTMVDLNVKNWDTYTGHCTIDIQVKEAWYIYPYIILELADRNFNVWKDEHDYSPDRINYGLALNHINLTGKKDKLKLKLQHGYTRKYEVLYEYPYIQDRLGAYFSYLYSNNKEIIYKTIASKATFLKTPEEKSIFSQHKIVAGLTHRTNAKLNQNLKIEWLSAKVDRYVYADKNPEYFGNGRSALSYISLDYKIKYDNTIYPLYPLGGLTIEFNTRKEGVGIGDRINNLWAAVTLENHIPVFKKLILSNKLKVKANFLDNPLPYFLNNAIGYQDNIITGYQLYVMDGRDFVIFTNALKFLTFEKDIHLQAKYLPNQFRWMNIKLFLRFNLDYGYARDPEYGEGNFLANKLNHGYGPALDVILYNNFTFSAQYGFTSFGEKGWFLKTDFNF